jgi:hypothetical protein
MNPVASATPNPSIANPLLQARASAGSAAHARTTPDLAAAPQAQAPARTDPAAGMAEIRGGPEASGGATPVPAQVSQAMADLLSGNAAGSSRSDLATLQGYFAAHPAALSSLMGNLATSGGTTYSAAGTTPGAQVPSAVIQSMTALLGGSGSGSAGQADLDTVQGYFKQRPGGAASLVARLGGSGSAGSKGAGAGPTPAASTFSVLG